MELTEEEQSMLDGEMGTAAQRSMEILVAIGKIYGAPRLIPVSSVQVAGVSYLNLGEAGLEFLNDMAVDGRVRVRTTLNPAGMDLEDWRKLGIDDSFAEKQLEVIEAYRRMGVETTCTCTPYLAGNLPALGEHLAWSESSAVCYANSVLGARTNREGGPSALAAALTGKTPEYGLHLDSERSADILVLVDCELCGTMQYSALGYVLGKIAGSKIPLLRGLEDPSIEELKALCASFATYGGGAMFHMEGVTPDVTPIPSKEESIEWEQIEDAVEALNDDTEIDLVAIGCPHASIEEIEEIARSLHGKKVSKELWIATSREAKREAARRGLIDVLEKAGAKIACDTCMAVAPLKGRFRGMATDSAKACYYGRGNNDFKVKLLSLGECLEEAVR